MIKLDKTVPNDDFRRTEEEVNIKLYELKECYNALKLLTKKYGNCTLQDIYEKVEIEQNLFNWFLNTKPF